MNAEVEPLVAFGAPRTAGGAIVVSDAGSEITANRAPSTGLRLKRADFAVHLTEARERLVALNVRLTGATEPVALRYHGRLSENVALPVWDIRLRALLTSSTMTLVVRDNGGETVYLDEPLMAKLAPNV